MLQLLTSKPVLYVCNVAEDEAATGNAHSERVAEMAAQQGAAAVVISAKIEEEIADIGIYLTELADNLGIDLLAAMDRKITRNAEKYPVARVRGKAKKYNEYP